MEPEPPGAGAGADPSRSESAPGPWRPGAGAAQKSGGSATLVTTVVDPNIVYLVPDPDIGPNLEPDPSRYTRLRYKFII